MCLRKEQKFWRINDFPHKAVYQKHVSSLPTGAFSSYWSLSKCLAASVIYMEIMLQFFFFTSSGGKTAATCLPNKFTGLK